MNIDKRIDELERRAVHYARLVALADAERWAHALGKSLDEALDPNSAAIEELWRHLGGELDSGSGVAPRDTETTPLNLCVWVAAYVAHRADTRAPGPDEVVRAEMDAWRRDPLVYRGDGQWDAAAHICAMAAEHGWDVEQILAECQVALAGGPADMADIDPESVVDTAEQVLRRARES